MQVRHRIEGNMTDDQAPNDLILTHLSNEYVIPARYLKQLVEAAQPAPKPRALDLFLKALDAMQIEYRWEESTCGNPRTAQVWFNPTGTWELVFEFDNQTGDFTGMYLEG
jgi:hypothetical protein